MDFRQFHHRQNKEEERRGKGRVGEKQQLLNKHREVSKKAAAASQT
jgi:RecA/RadA recombinase